MKAIIFDLDGTLIHSAPDIHAAVNKTLAETGDGELDLATVATFIGNGVPVLMERVIAARGLDPARHAAMTATFLKHYEADPATLTTLYPGVEDALEQFRDEGWVMGVCTNKPEAASRAILDAFGIGHFFGAVVGGDTLDVRKPDPATALAVKERLGADAAVYVGDSEIDAECAWKAGMRFALFTEGYHRAEDVDDIPQDARFSDFDVLVAVVARLADELR
ncbi:phosphoglycolate phosphatase [Rhodovulum euryhalinum]|uniref:Phosphoglycolate phosphatase n=1 Tax=Rhodovulum euryhalinum TaxID=35805 RepID=A0A4R2KBV4_9RHOB|nr:phosphoglycolate phosphatase [Rhodovulum euryhalinum]TCO70324.1 phosphoglycolate phosphatase [Rhodovulum euryhalinum]